jgi:peroxiredoxin Q/BCP
MPLAPGQKAPPFALTNDAGEQVTLADFAGRRLVLFFFPKAGTSG